MSTLLFCIINIEAYELFIRIRFKFGSIVNITCTAIQNEYQTTNTHKRARARTHSHTIHVEKFSCQVRSEKSCWNESVLDLRYINKLLNNILRINIFKLNIVL